MYSRCIDYVGSWPPIVFPEIRLCGKWLQDAGFEHGQLIRVEAERNKVTIIIERVE